jgi:ribosomal-protein-serine acetyltransferase
VHGTLLPSLTQPVFNGKLFKNKQHTKANQMKSYENWKLETIDAILPEEFYTLIENNRAHIESTFPVTIANCSNFEKTIELIEKNKRKQNDKEGYFYYLRNLESHQLIGYVCIKNIDLKILKCELAYFIDKNFEGKGIITDAVSQVIAFCFDTFQMNKVFICTSKINAASQQIALKQGFQKEGVLRQEFKNGHAILEDIVYFGLLKSEYQSYEK